MGPKVSHYIMGALSIFGSISLIVVWYADSPKLMMVFIMLSKFGLAAAFNMAFINFVTLTPTILTATCFGFGNFFARLLTSTSSIVAEMDHVTALTISISFCVIQMIATYFLIIKLPRFV